MSTRAERKLGPRTDVFALGGILFTLLAGRPPAPDEEPATALAAFPRVDAPLRELCVHAMEIDPADRPADAAALAERFGAWRRGARKAAQQSAAAAEAEAAYRTLPSALQAALPVFLARLVGPDGAARPTSVCAAPSGALETLEAARLVARDGDEARLLDPALPRTWSRLRGWVEANPERHQQLHLLIEVSRAWAAAGRPSRLLWTDQEAVAEAGLPGPHRGRGRLSGCQRAAVLPAAEPAPGGGHRRGARGRRGRFGPSAAWRDQVVPAGPEPEPSRGRLTKRCARGRSERARRRWPWSDLLWHVFGVDGFACPHCGEQMVVRAVVVRPPATLRVLGGLDRAASRAPPAGGAQAA